MRIALFAALALLTACTREEQETVAEKFDRQTEEIQQKAREIERDVENEVSAIEDSLENRADEVLRNLQVPASNEAATQNKSR